MKNATSQRLQALLANQKLFSGLTRKQLERIISVSELKQLKSNEVLFAEGEVSDILYVIYSGCIGLTKFDEVTHQPHEIAVLDHEGSFVGDISFLQNTPRSCTAYAKEDVTLLAISKEIIVDKLTDSKSILSKIKTNMVTVLTNRLTATNEKLARSLQKEVDGLRQRNEFGFLFITALLLFLLVSIVNNLIYGDIIDVEMHTESFNWIYLFLITAPIILMIHKFHWKMQEFGLTTNDLGKSILDGIFFGASVVILLGLFMTIRDRNTHEAVAWYKNSMPNIRATHYLYFFHAFLQEFLARGVLQNSFQRFFDDKKGYFSIGTASIVFALFHSHWGNTGMLVVFFSSLLFGYIFLRTKNLAGVTIAHFIIGFYALHFGVL